MLVINAPASQTMGLFVVNDLFSSQTQPCLRKSSCMLKITWSQSRCFVPHVSSFSLSASSIMLTALFSKNSILTMLWEISDLINTLIHLALVQPKWILSTHLLMENFFPNYNEMSWTWLFTAQCLYILLDLLINNIILIENYFPQYLTVHYIFYNMSNL